MFGVSMFMEQMEENTKFNLIFPYHIQKEKLLGNLSFSETEETFHKHTFEEVLSVAYKEPLAFYLTECDETYYSKQELEFIKRVIDCERDKNSKGYQVCNFELDEETINMLNEYRKQRNLTIEEVVNEILKEIIKMEKEKSNR